MKKLIKIMILGVALAVPLISQAVDLYWFADVTISFDGVNVNSSDGYIATFWAANETQGETPVMIATSLLSNGRWGGDDETTWVMGLPAVDNDIYYTSVRVFQYTPGQMIGNDALVDLDALTKAWNALTGTDVVQGLVEGHMSVGVPPVAIFPADDYPTTLVLNGVAGTPIPGAIPEPSTYAVIAGVALLAYAVIRRRK